MQYDCQFQYSCFVQIYIITECIDRENLFNGITDELKNHKKK